MFPSLSGKTFIRTNIGSNKKNIRGNKSFHPFQGRPSFGLAAWKDLLSILKRAFPSLSGKTFIRTLRTNHRRNRDRGKVSIPFREDLHSDRAIAQKSVQIRDAVSIPFREDLHSDISEFMKILEVTKTSFHPFQGRPSFGQGRQAYSVRREINRFPSLSGKTFIRTEKIAEMVDRFYWVSIPFREDLHSDQGRQAHTIRRKTHVSIPFREDLHSDRVRVIQNCKKFGCFHPFQGRPSFGQNCRQFGFPSAL